jgi:hypothetical protein
MHRALAAAIAVIALVYVPSVAFAMFYPYCHVNKEIESICYVGATNYGRTYDAICFGLFLVTPGVAWVVLRFFRAVGRRRTPGRGNGGNAA